MGAKETHGHRLTPTPPHFLTRMLAFSQVLRVHWPSYRARFGRHIPLVHRDAVRAIVRCRTAALGGGRYRCACGEEHFAYHSCGHRACPQCGHADALLWREKQRTKLLPVPYFLVTFTVPESLRNIIRSHQKIFYHLLFAHSSGALLDVALSKLNLQLGLLGVLHTWSRQLIFHPHVHYVVPGGGLTPDGLRWQRVQDPQFLLSTRVLAARFRNRLRQQLELHHNELLRAIPAAAWRQRGVVDVQPVGSGQSAL